MSLNLPVLIAASVATLSIIALYKKFKGGLISYIRGPKSNSFIFGHLLEIGYSPAGDFHFPWQDEFGSVIRIKALFGADKLILSDPKALQYIFHKSAYSFTKPNAARTLMHTMDGPDLVWSEVP
ncbi:hypothetical protein OE88DRAFT_1740338 [Heliocybe sulcata]|uniref:Cytochrome P450 n=1 Tax=Heliocybe sulcata TaxID=5364 RepID=A0A5C3ML07_9AGAM|nr:hypothetical protein OE88DRAFT_1740338 [Heliocybe sulcata]